MMITYWPNGSIHTIEHTANNVIHNEHGPARLTFSSLGRKVYEEWRHHGMQHRPDGAAVRSWNDRGQQITEEWLFFGRPHRDDGPAICRWTDNGQRVLEMWAQHGELHRVNGPAYVKITEAEEESVWMQNGIEYREDGLPTEVTRRAGFVRMKWPMHQWLFKHRIAGPYIISSDGAEWWYRDTQYSFEEYWSIPENCILNTNKVKIIKTLLPQPIFEELLHCLWPDGLAKYAEIVEKIKDSF